MSSVSGISSSFSPSPSQLVAKSYHRLCTALLQLRLIPTAKAVCELAVRDCPTEAALSDLLLRIKTCGQAEPAARPPSAAPRARSGDAKAAATLTLLTERQIQERESRTQCDSAESIALINNMMAMMPVGGAARTAVLQDGGVHASVMQWETRIPLFHQDFARQGRFDAWGLRCVVASVPGDLLRCLGASVPGGFGDWERRITTGEMRGSAPLPHLDASPFLTPRCCRILVITHQTFSPGDNPKP